MHSPHVQTYLDYLLSLSLSMSLSALFVFFERNVSVAQIAIVPLQCDISFNHLPNINVRISSFVHHPCHHVHSYLWSKPFVLQRPFHLYILFFVISSISWAILLRRKACNSNHVHILKHQLTIFTFIWYLLFRTRLAFWYLITAIIHWKHRNNEL